MGNRRCRFPFRLSPDGPLMHGCVYEHDPMSVFYTGFYWCPTWTDAKHDIPEITFQERMTLNRCRKSCPHGKGKKPFLLPHVVN